MKYIGMIMAMSMMLLSGCGSERVIKTDKNTQTFFDGTSPKNKAIRTHKRAWYLALDLYNREEITPKEFIDALTQINKHFETNLLAAKLANEQEKVRNQLIDLYFPKEVIKREPVKLAPPGYFDKSKRYSEYLKD